jgi:uncharacterized phiE125 gp8 family phage protein
MNLTVIIEPAFEPVTLADVYQHLRLDPDDSPATHPDDSALQRHIVSARKMVELMTRRALVEQTIRLSMGNWPASNTYWPMRWSPREQVREIRLFRPPVIAVESVSYYDHENSLVALDPADYYLTDEQVPELRFVNTFSAATLYDRPDAVRVRYRAGYLGDGSPVDATQAEAAANVPEPLKEAVLMGVQLLYDDLSPADRMALENMREATVQPFRVQHAL